MNYEEIAKQYGISVEEIKSIEDKTRKKYASVASLLSKEQIEQYVKLGIDQHLNKYKNAGLTQYFGVVLTMSSPKDGMIKARSECVKKYVEDPDGAITTGYVTEYRNGLMRSLNKGVIISKAVTPDQVPKTAVYLPDQKAYIVPLDARESWPNGKKNFGYLKALPLERYFLHLHGLASTDGSNWTEFHMSINNMKHPNVPNVNIPMSQLVKFHAKTKKTGETLELGYHKDYTKFEPVEGDIHVLDGNIMTYKDMVSLAEIPTVFANRKDAFEIVSVFGSTIYKKQKEATEEKEFPWITSALMDPSSDTPLRLTIHPDVSAKFDANSLVKVWGTLSMGKKWDPENNQSTDEDEISMFVNGIYAFGETAAVEAPATDIAQDDGWAE